MTRISVCVYDAFVCVCVCVREAFVCVWEAFVSMSACVCVYEAFSVYETFVYV